MKEGCPNVFVTRGIICWWVETPPVSSLIILGHILKHGLLKNQLSFLLSRPLLLHGLRPIHPLTLPKALFLIEVVGVLIIRIISSPIKFISFMVASSSSSIVHSPTSIIVWE